MEEGCEDHWPGAPWSTELLPVHQGLAVAGPSSGRVHWEIQGEPAGRLWGWVRREGCGDIFECVLAGPGLTQDQLFSKSESRSSLLFVGRSGGPR